MNGENHQEARSISNQHANNRRLLVVDVLSQATASIGMTKLSESFRFNLANTFSRHTEKLSYFFESSSSAVVQAKSQSQYVSLTR